MKIKKYVDYRLNKRSEKLFLALILMGYDYYTGQASLARNSFKYYILRPNKTRTYFIFIHKYKAKLHTSALPNGNQRIKVTKIAFDTLKTLADLWKT